VVEKQPEYLDGYIMASYYAEMLGKKDEALTYLDRALRIDPNNTKIQELKQQLLSK